MGTFSIWHWLILCAVAILYTFLIYRIVMSIRRSGNISAADRPSNVVRFEQVMYFSIGVVLIRAVVQSQNLSNNSGVTRLAVAAVIISALTVFFAWLISRRRLNWARWAFLIFFILSIPGYAAILSNRFQADLGGSILSVVQLSLYGFGAFLVFTGNAVSWFRNLPREAAQEI